MLAAIAGLASRRPWRVVALVVVFVALSVVFGVRGLGGLSSEGFDDPASETVRAEERLLEATGEAPGASLVALVEPGSSVTAGAGAAAVERVADALRADPGVARVAAPEGPDSPQVSRDGDAAYVVAAFRGDADSADVVARLEDRLGDDPAIMLGGPELADEEVGEIIGGDIARAELIAFPILFLVSFFVFRGLVAALMPLMVGAVTILGGFLGLAAANELTSVSIYATNLVIGLGLGLAIDYALLIVSRYREEMAAHGPGRQAMTATMRSAGRSVVFSALTVAAALAGLMVFPQDFLFSMGLGGVIVALIAAVASLTLLPAVLVLLGHRLGAGAPKAWRRRGERADQPVTAGFWYRLSRFVLARPGRMAVIAAAVMIALGLPILGISFTTVDARVLPTSSGARQVNDALAQSFPQDRSDPIVVTVGAGDAEQAQVSAFADRVRAVPGLSAVDEPRYVGDDVWVVTAVPADEPLSGTSQAAVERIRDLSAPGPVLVGGTTAGFVDEKSSIASHLPAAIGVIAGATLVLLFLLTGSVVLAVKAVVMNGLTLIATMGILAFGFAEGGFEAILGFDSIGGVSLTQPILIAALAFGLSTDYGVFLLSRIKEAHDSGLDTTEAVAVGLQRTGRIVTAAAVLFMIAIGAFATSQIVIIKELGVGTALAVLIDATIVRALLVPSLMGLLGRWNWWAPKPLARLHARLGLSEA